LHHLALSIVAVPKMVLMKNKWNDLFQCFIACYAMRPEQPFMEASDITHYLAVLKYSMRCVVFYEVTLRLDEDKYQDDFDL
jgi:hypothetical protein